MKRERFSCWQEGRFVVGNGFIVVTGIRCCEVWFVGGGVVFFIDGVVFSAR